MTAIIQARNLTKQFKIYDRKQGLLGAARTLFSTKHRVLRAVDGLSFDIEEGELVGFIGANGAGKSTTTKMLAGILHPTSGELHVLGNVPHRARKENARRIGVVFGHRSQLFWDLPLIETFNVLRWVYSLSAESYERQLTELTEHLDMSEFIRTPVRSLSLGQRSRGNIAASLLHEPDILFLDEPTIGLDVVTRDSVLDFVRHLNETRKVTVLLTTHDLINLEKVCRRMIVIDRGRTLFDGDREELMSLFGRAKYALIQFRENVEDLVLDPSLAILSREGHAIHLEFDPAQTPLRSILEKVEQSGTVIDVSVSNPSIESIVKKLIPGG
jgi:viologen exporter family transport system ATP-binding protein